RDAFTRDRISMFKNPAIDSRFRDRDDDGDFYASTFEVRDVRRVRNEVRALSGQEEAAATGSFEEVAARLTGIRDRIEAQASLLWPSQKKQALSRIDERLAASGRTEAQRRMAEIENTGTPDARLELSRAALADGDLVYWKFLPLAERDAHLQ